jgi:hypothetical protein
MTDYTKSTNFASKDSLSPGSALKIVRGTEIDTEFNNIATAVATKANSSDVTSSLATKADLASPALTGNPTAPTPTAGDNDTSIATTAFVTTAVAALGYPAFKNRIINGAMMIDQRNAGASISVTGTGFPVDRFYINANSFGVISGQRSTTAPTGFINSTLMTVTTARSSIAASDVYGIRQTIEGFNTADLGWGTASAQAVTLSFWVRSSITGTYAVSFFNTAFNRSYVATYTINAANTYEYKTITLAGDTTGTWGTDNTGGISVFWDLGSGSDFQATANTWVAAGDLRTSGSANWISTNGATFYITGVQLEKGSTATSFDYRPYGTELALCQRYYWKPATEPIGLAATGFGAGGRLNNPVPMRSAATISGATFSVNTGSAGTVTSLYQTVNGQIVYNSANNWTTNAAVSVNGEVSSEL